MCLAQNTHVMPRLAINSWLSEQKGKPWTQESVGIVVPQLSRNLVFRNSIRAVWQRTANRCFVQEDAKRAPKLACATSKLVDIRQVSAAYESDHAAVNVAAFSRKSSFLNIPPDSRWWLMQPNQGFQNFLTYEQLNALEDEVKFFKDSDENKAYELDDTQLGDYNLNSSYYIQHDLPAVVTNYR
ncbi:hypothetical protein RIF29_07255 [Crotalaria pallida]|uniref:Uncharacterized protein n=1 Tax=Crotalaria pallida TaxID=3830 RepID=A0AAN9PAR2_CROPI